MKKFLIIILGPTCVGKTESSIFLASHLNSHIFSADARQFYKEMTIGTAKPTSAELNKIQHHFINNLSVRDDYNVWKFEKDIIQSLGIYYKEHDIAILTGGSGLYIRAVSEGIDELPDVKKEIRTSLNDLYKEKGISVLQKKLSEIDPEYYHKVDKKNPMRLIRALEIAIGTGKAFSLYQNQPKKKRDFNIIKIGLQMDREQLYDRINQRTENMFSNGIVKEAESLYEFRYLTALKTVGYRELFDFIDGKISIEKAKEMIKQNTRKYAKRQMTWFKKENEVSWFHPKEQKAMLNYIKQKIKK